jgi:mevalonate kinase
LTFPRDWGLGSSSTLINNIAQWAHVNAFELLGNAFSGSGYDIANAQNNTPILYQLENRNSQVKTIDFLPEFSDQLYFIHLNQKQKSREGIARYKEYKMLRQAKHDIERISIISVELAKAKTLHEFEQLIEEHEQIIAKIIQLEPVKSKLFPDYFGSIKSLGAWGGDFILATGNKNTPDYFKEKGYATVLKYKEMVL